MVCLGVVVRPLCGHWGVGSLGGVNGLGKRFAGKGDVMGLTLLGSPGLGSRGAEGTYPGHPEPMDWRWESLPRARWLQTEGGR